MVIESIGGEKMDLWYTAGSLIVYIVIFGLIGYGIYSMIKKRKDKLK